MRWRTTLTHAIEGSVTPSESEGLVSAIIGLSRHQEFHTLVKEFKSAFRAYGSNGTQDGRRDWIKNIESIYGPDAVITILVEYSSDNYIFETLYEGEIGIQTIIEGLELDHYLEFTPVQTGMWRNFISRYDVAVDIQSPLSLDGVAVTVYTPETITLLSQKIRAVSDFDQSRFYDYGTNYDPAPLFPSSTLVVDLPRSQAFQINLQDKTIDEITFNQNVPNGSTDVVLTDDGVPTGSERVNPMFVIEYAGDYQIDILLPFTEKDYFYEVGNPPIYQRYNSTNGVADISGGEESPLLKVFLQINDDTPVELSRTDHGVGTSQWSEYTISTLLNLSVGDKIKLYGLPITGSGSPGYYYFYNTSGNQFQMKELVLLGVDNSNILWSHIPPLAFDGTPNSAFITIVSNNIYPSTEVSAFLQHDVAASILDRITEPDKFHSELMGSPYTQARVYSSNGDWWKNALIKLIHARGYTLSEKLFSLSFKDFWEGANPMFNLSLGYETIDGVERIVIRTKAEAYDSSSMSTLLSGVQRIKRKYGPDYFNGAKMGALTGKTEDISGIDDPYTRTAASILKNIGRVFTNLTSWIFQGLTIEQARRTTKIKSADYKYDDNIAVIEVTRTGEHTYQPRLNEDFDSVTGLLNEDTRYNKHHTPARFFLRWLDYLSGGLQKYLGTVFRFTGGEGNYDMTSEMVNGSAPDAYGGDVLAENANIPVGNNYLWIPKIFEIDHYITFEQFKIIDANRNLAIGISQTQEDHAEFFIDDMQFEIMSGSVRIVGKFKNEFDIITVPPGSQIFSGGRTWDITFDTTFGDFNTP